MQGRLIELAVREVSIDGGEVPGPERDDPAAYEQGGAALREAEYIIIRLCSADEDDAD